MSKAEQLYKNRVVSLGCIVCRYCLGYEDTPAEVHHIRDGMGTSMRNNDFNILPLCPFHHRGHGNGNSFHDGRETWEKKFRPPETPEDMCTERYLQVIVNQLIKEIYEIPQAREATITHTKKVKDKDGNVKDIRQMVTVTRVTELPHGKYIPGGKNKNTKS